MKKFIALFMAAVLAVGCAAANAESLTFSSMLNITTDEFEAFQAAHPDLVIKRSSVYYDNSSELFGALVTREFDHDVLLLFSSQYDIQQLMAKGYLLDLSQNTAIADLVHQMYPNIIDQLTYDGKVYAIPKSIRFKYALIDRNVWELAGLSEREMPTSFEALLDFLDDWCDRIEKEPEPNIRIISSWDADTYNQASYTTALTEMLINHYIAQLQYTGEAISFHDEAFTSLLQRVEIIGRRLYELEEPMDAFASGIKKQLFRNNGTPNFPTRMDNVIFMRLTDDQPQIIQADMDMLAAYAGTSLPSEAIDFLEKDLMGQYNQEFLHTAPIHYFYADSESVINPGWDDELLNVQGRIDAIELQLQVTDISLDQREELENQLEAEKKWLNTLQSDGYKYKYSPEQHQSYNAHVNDLYFAKPHVFTSGTDGHNNLRRLVERFAAGLLPTTQFLSELENLAWMLEMENQ